MYKKWMKKKIFKTILNGRKKWLNFMRFQHKCGGDRIINNKNVLNPQNPQTKSHFNRAQ